MIGLFSFAFLLKTRFQITSRIRLVIFTLLCFFVLGVPPPIIFLWFEEKALCWGTILAMLWFVVPSLLLYFDTMRLIRKKEI
jgi:hypothetical protein